MSTQGAQFGKDVFEPLNIEYENAYKHNPFKRACIEKSISMLKPGSRVLDVGCGTGVPVSSMLAEADMAVTGIDIAPSMIEIAKSKVKGEFLVADCLEYQPQGTFDAIFVSAAEQVDLETGHRLTLSLTYADVHAMVFRLAKSLSVGGLLVVGQDAADDHVSQDDPHWDETHS
ncbi:hypothetical protein LTR56_008052 [Elasticomyces elasticus]|nr:hypothetical protein LTR56_008052 [Elasticomyces elasticus]